MKTMNNPKSNISNPQSLIPNLSARRGVLLLLVLSLLALFALIAVAFVIISGQAQRSARSIERFEQVIDPPEDLLHQAAMQVFRGPTTTPAGVPDLASVMGVHSLLEDIYGDEPLWTGPHPTSGASTSSRSCIITSVQSVCGGQLVEFTYQLLVPDPLAPLAPAAQIADPLLARRLGCVITFIQSPTNSFIVGESTRLVSFNPSNPALGQMLALGSGTPAVGDIFTINGVPFSGTGFGYDSSSHDLDLTFDTSVGTGELSSAAPDTTHWSVALLPNLPLSIYADTTANPSGFTFGGANEDNDVADFQNMLLAAQVPIRNDPSNPGRVTSVQTLPSLHRPALIRYWINELIPSSGTWPQLCTQYPELCRKIMLRPLTIDHPNFTGSNPNFNPIWNMIDGAYGSGQWDVDNDGEGEADSVWVDLGMPVRQTTDGRLYKPLFAILCVDLDGRVNLNAHGSLPQTDTANYNIPISQAGGTLAGSVSARGQGLGPADINLGYLLDPTYPIDATYSNRLMSAFNGYQGRYGTDNGPGPLYYPGLAGPDQLSTNKWFEYGNQKYWDFSAVNNAGAYGSPPDVFGVGAVGLDLAGRPLYIGMNYQGLPAQYVGAGCGVSNSPYELNLDRNQTRGLPSNIATVDNPFSPAELERILRPFDRDAPSLPDRLAQLSASTAGDPRTSVLYNVRHSVTTESWDLPCPNVVTPSSLTATELGRLADDRVKHITDLLLARGVPASEWAELLPADLLAGLRMNINRPFGNGLDDLAADGSDVVDAPAETTSQPVMLNGVPVSPFSFDGTDGTVSGVTTSLAARQLEARFLYVLACLTVDLNSLNDPTRFGSYEETARFLAQWAVNVVDFKDRDSIMTPFDYDPNFANPSATPAGWNVTAGTSPRVWGCERPELLISETLAFHDRRTEDTSSEQAVTTETDDHTAALYHNTAPADHDASFDQRFKPQGSLFIELYNPWSIMEPRSGDLYTASDGGVDLTKVSATGNSPVWRMIIVDDTEAGKDPDDPDPTQLPIIERAIYFTGPTAAPALPADGTVHFQPDDAHAARIAPIYPGRYAVIGPGKSTHTTESITYLGFDNGENPGNVGTSPNETRRIELNPDSNPNQTGQVAVFNNGTTDDLSSLTIKNPTAVVITMPTDQRLSVSEPDGGYTDIGPDGSTPYTETTGYVPTCWDVPFDTGSSINNNGRTDHVKIIHLQRLANPLLPYNNTPTNPSYNPYRTIDSMPIDLTAFNGIDTSTDPAVISSTNNRQFYARQRGQHNSPVGSPVGTMNLWGSESFNESPTANVNRLPPDLSTTIFNLKDWPLHHSLGLLNDPYGLPSNTSGYEGDPRQPFSWLTWNNRPYISPPELMQVSWLRSSQLLEKYNMAQGSDDPYSNPSKPFPHLTNFFVSGSGGTEDEELYRVFEYLGVPSPFVGTETQANPTTANIAGHNFRPPFNRISTYREPGRINLNTIYDKSVFYALMNGFPTMNTSSFWKKFVGSRQGKSGSSNMVLGCVAGMPTEFARPFRSFGGRALTPDIGTMQPSREIDCTLLRADPSDNTRPLFQYNSSAQVDNTDRNPYFRYQGLQRLGNLVTTRSNVYAVWITVGYFEVTPLPAGYNTSIYPDGYTLGQELGMDTGEIERHRAFYIFDRSIPVGFQRGQDLNVEKAILVDRFIE